MISIDSFHEQDWRSFIIWSLDQPSSIGTTKNLNDFIVVMANFIIETVVEG